VVPGLDRVVWKEGRRRDPALRTLVFSKGRKPTLRFIDEVCRDWGGEGDTWDGGEGDGGLSLVSGGQLSATEPISRGGGGGGGGGSENSSTGTGFNKIIAAHYDAPVAADAADLRRAFTFLTEPGPDGLGLRAAGAELPEEDMVTLLRVNEVLEKIGLGKGTE